MPAESCTVRVRMGATTMEYPMKLNDTVQDILDLVNEESTMKYTTVYTHDPERARDPAEELSELGAVEDETLDVTVVVE